MSQTKGEKKQNADSAVIKLTGPVIRLTGQQISDAVNLYCRQELGLKVTSVTVLNCVHRRNQQTEYVAEIQLSAKQTGGLEQ